jgi:murein DD-endopeptidase MepM/ murein hydrolase activator NlpD
MRTNKEKTTILFVNKTAQGIKPMQISSGLILHWKKYVATIACMFLVLLGYIGLLMSKSIEQSKIQMALSNRLHSMHQVIAEVDTNAVHDKFTKIDKELSTINGFLKARGIKTVFKGPQGGEENNNDIVSTEEISNFYEDYLRRIVYNISYTPLGFPYPGRITSTFGHRENPFTGENVETHKGLDIKGPLGGPVKAMAFAGLRGGFGNCIMLKHGNGFETLYGHLSKILVRVDQKIEIGQQIGNIGSTGRSTGPHLHYEVHKNGQQINPASFLTLQ